MPLSDHDTTGFPPKKPSGNKVKKDNDFTEKLYRLIDKVHTVDIRDSTKPDTEYANAFKLSCEKENISNVVSIFNNHCINTVYTDNTQYLVDCKFKIIASSETELIENYDDLAKRKNSAAYISENYNEESIASELESKGIFKGYDPTYGCGYESLNSNEETVHAETTEENVEKKYCFKCGKELKDGAFFCTYCGTKQNEIEIRPINTNEPLKEDSNTNWKDLFLKNNLGEYIDLFVKNKLDDIEIISKLNETDLEKLGMTIMGDRKKILKVISDEIGNKREKVRKLYQQGWSINEIAKALKMEENLLSFYCGTKKNEAETTYSSSSGEQKNMESSPIRLEKKLIKYIIIIAIVLIALLPFHYVFGYGDFGIKIFPKDNLTFKHTFITDVGVRKIITRYNNANFLDKLQIQTEPFFKKLMEEGIIYRQ